MEVQLSKNHSTNLEGALEGEDLEAVVLRMGNSLYLKKLVKSMPQQLW
jgi:hypothetical protein